MHIFYDGALVSDIDCCEVLYREPVAPATAQELVQLARDRKIYLELYTDNQYYAETVDQRAQAHTRLLGFPPQPADLKKLASKASIIKAEMVLLSHREADHTLLAEARERFKNRLRFSVATSPILPEIEFVNIVSPLVSKGEALRRLARAWHLELESIAAIGDGDNDLPLLQLAGLAIAMGNATDAVKKAAHHVTEPVSRDGVASAIRRWILPK